MRAGYRYQAGNLWPIACKISQCKARYSMDYNDGLLIILTTIGIGLVLA